MRRRPGGEIELIEASCTGTAVRLLYSIRTALKYSEALLMVVGISMMAGIL